jgi:hypothetical protein
MPHFQSYKVKDVSMKQYISIDAEPIKTAIDLLLDSQSKTFDYSEQ